MQIEIIFELNGLKNRLNRHEKKIPRQYDWKQNFIFETIFFNFSLLLSKGLNKKDISNVHQFVKSKFFALCRFIQFKLDPSKIPTN
jgi:hypothetical protein